MSFGRITDATPGIMAKIKAGMVGSNQLNDGPKCLDPLTGKLITVEEFNSKYDNGKAMLQVYIPRDDGTAMLENMTAADYIQRFGKSTNPPKAIIVPSSDDEVKPATGGTYNALKGMGLTDSEIEEYFDKPDTSDPKSIDSIVYTLKEGITVNGKEIKSVDELVQALKEEKLQKLIDAKAAESIMFDDSPKCLDPLTRKLISVDLFNQKYDNGNAVLRVIIPRDNGMGMLQYMTATDYVREFGNSVNPPKAFLA